MGYGYGLQPPKALADVIMQMSYGDLLEVARELYEMNAGENTGLRNMDSKYGMADTLFDWADAVIEEVNEAELQAKAKAA
jgi:hypothetical protein